MSNSVSKLFVHPITIIAVLITAVLTGLYYPDVSKNFDKFGSYYISLLKMVVLPYLFACITNSIAQMTASPHAKNFAIKIIVLYPIALGVAALIALATTYAISPAGQVDANSLTAFGNIVSGASTNHYVPDAEVALTAHSGATAADAGVDVVSRFIPENIFFALSSGDTLKVVVFCILFGAAIAKSSGQGTSSLLEILSIIQSGSTEVIRWLNYILPFALFAMVSSQVSNVGLAPLASLGHLIQAQVMAGGLIILLCAMLISIRARVFPLAAISRLGETLTLAITTRSSIACIPVAINELTTKLRFERITTELILPLGITICRLGAVPYYVIGTIFIAQIYSIDLGPYQLLTIGVAAVAASLASSGATGPMSVLLIALVAEPLKLPVEAAIILFIAIDPILDIVRTLVLVYGNCALTALISPLVKDSNLQETETETALVSVRT